MLLKRLILDGIVAGSIDLAFRRWRMARVRPGSLLRTAVGLVRIESVEQIEAADIGEAEAKRAGARSRDTLLAGMSGREGEIHRIVLRHVGADPREHLRKTVPSGEAELATIEAELRRIDAAGRRPPWTLAVLQLIAAHPGEPARRLAEQCSRPLPRFKADVRRLKELGLTESLETGYRLSPRGHAVLRRSRDP